MIEPEGGGTYQQVVSVGVGAVGEPTRFFVVEFSPSSGTDGAGIAAVGVVWREVGGSTTDVWSEELGGPIFELSAQLEDVLAETGVLLLEIPDAAQGVHFVVGEAHRGLEPGDGLLELGEAGVSADANGTIGRRNGDGCTCST